jgi:hypothetical protein
MNIREEIINARSKADILAVASFACESKQHCKELMRCFNANESKLSQKAAWCVSWAFRKKTEIIQPYIKDVVAKLKNKELHNGIIRSAVQILERIDIPERFQGEVMDACFNFIETPSTAIAIKAFSLTTLFNLSKQYPEIGPELKLIIQERWDTETAAFRSRGKKILAALE